MKPHSQGIPVAALGSLVAILALASLAPLRAQQRAARDSAQLAQMQEMMGPMMEQMATAGMTATLKVLARPESSQELATLVRNFSDAPWSPRGSRRRMPSRSSRPSACPIQAAVANVAAR